MPVLELTREDATFTWDELHAQRQQERDTGLLLWRDIPEDLRLPDLRLYQFPSPRCAATSFAGIQNGWYDRLASRKYLITEGFRYRCLNQAAHGGGLCGAHLRMLYNRKVTDGVVAQLRARL